GHHARFPRLPARRAGEPRQDQPGPAGQFLAAVHPRRGRHHRPCRAAGGGGRRAAGRPHRVHRAHHRGDGAGLRRHRPPDGRRGAGAGRMNPQLDALWVYLQANPLGWLTATLIAYWLGVKAQRAAGGRPYVNPVAIAVVLLVALLVATGTPYQTYFQGAQFVHFLLGPATVALAVPLYQNWPAVRRSVVPMLAALLAGAVTAVVSALGIAWALGASAPSLVSIAPKSVTMPVAM